MRYYVGDAFSSHVFGGGPAAVVVSDAWLPDATMQAISAENNLADTAYAVRRADGDYDLRWFMPEGEINLNGHATLVCSHVIFTYVEPERDQITYHAQSGTIRARRVAGTAREAEDSACDADAKGGACENVTREAFAEAGVFGDDVENVASAESCARAAEPEREIEIDLPAVLNRPYDLRPDMVAALGGATPAEVHFGENLLFVFRTEAEVAALQPDFAKMRDLPEGFGCFATAPANAGSGFDIVGRTFWPKMGVNEDPVCGNMHCNLAPFWTARLGKSQLVSHQLSPRGAVVKCAYAGGPVTLRGAVSMFLEGEIFV